MYQVQKGDTIAKVTRLLNTTWENLRRLNPKAVGQSQKTGRWFLKEGATLTMEPSFESALREAQEAGKIPSKAMRASPGLCHVPTQVGLSIRQAQDVRHRSIQNKPAGRDEFAESAIKCAETQTVLALDRSPVRLEDIAKESNLEGPLKVQQGIKVRYRPPQFLRPHPVVASWYGDSHQGKTMANGKPYDMHAPTIAHKDLPLGTKVELHNTETGEQAMAVVTDRGPYIEGRDVDLSYEVARRLSLVDKGVGMLLMRILE